MGTVRFGRSGRLGFPQGAHRGEKGGAGGHEGVGCVDTHLHLTRIFLPRRSLSTTSIMRAVAYPSDGAYDAWKCAPRVATSTFCHDFPKFRRSRSPNEVLNGQVRPLRARATIMLTRSALLLIALLLGCLLGARAQATVSFSPTSAFPNRCASTHRRHPREKRPHSKRGPTDGRLTHHSHPSPSLTNFTGTPGTCARSSRPRRNPTARASWTPPTARHAAASPWRSARPTAR